MKRTPIYLAVLAVLSMQGVLIQKAQAERIDFSNAPASSSHKLPIPNVIISVDTSGSMGYCDVLSDGQLVVKTSGCASGTTRMAYTKAGLKTALTNTTKYDGQMRLAWQSFACNSIPSNSGSCNNKNAIAVFSGTHKKNFETWVNALSATGSTPSHVVVWNAGEYLKKTDIDSPWNKIPGQADPAPLSCRRAFHIFLTDGGWNFKFGDAGLTDTAFKTDMAFAKNATSPKVDVRNYDGKDRTLPTPAPQSEASYPEGSPYGQKNYVISSNETRVYRDEYGGGDRTVSSVKYAYPSLADIAFYHWASDLQPDIENEVRPKINKLGAETFSLNGKTQTLSEYWNPKNNPAEWQHLTQYTIGYGARAGSLPKVNTTSPQWVGGMYGNGFASLVVGETKWDDVTSTTADGTTVNKGYDYVRPQEMWHMAINSRGKFYPVTGGDLSEVFQDIFDDILKVDAPPSGSFASASGLISRSGTKAFRSTYIAVDDIGGGQAEADSSHDRWYGYVESFSVSTSGKMTENSDWGGKNTGELLQTKVTKTSDTRVIITYNANTSKAVPFLWNKLSGDQKNWLTGSDTATIGERRLKYVRGQTQYDGTDFRRRKSPQADIVNSDIWYTGNPSSGFNLNGYVSFAQTQRNREHILYVGGNDGMLHAFSAKNGQEKLAYVPYGVYSNFIEYTRPAYQHRYFVDGSPMTADIHLGNNQWATYLIGTLGAGGRGYFALNVTNPSNFQEANAENLVVFDKTAITLLSKSGFEDEEVEEHVDPDIGHIFAPVATAEDNDKRSLQITQMNDGRWAYITGNGYNSFHERPVLMIQYLDQNKELKKIIADETPNATNGLSALQFLDINGDNIPDFIYAGDLHGNLWKFDISSNNALNWNVAFGGQPLFQAKDSDGKPQPITTAPIIRPNTEAGGLMIAFGTGRNLTDADKKDTFQQSVYSIRDNTQYQVELINNKSYIKITPSNPTPQTVNGRNSLMKRVINDDDKTKGAGKSEERTFWTSSSEERITYSCGQGDSSCQVYDGWYFDLPDPGERVTSPLAFYDGSNIIEILSEKPASGSPTEIGKEACVVLPEAARPYRTLFGIQTGAPASVPLMDINGDGIFDEEDMKEGKNFNRMTADSRELRLSGRDTDVRHGKSTDHLGRLPEVLLRPNWRQLK